MRYSILTLRSRYQSSWGIRNVFQIRFHAHALACTRARARELCGLGYDNMDQKQMHVKTKGIQPIHPPQHTTDQANQNALE